MPFGSGGPPKEILDQTREILIAATEAQMMGDVPVGVFLSGGLDSSLIAAIAARWLRARDERLITFAVGTEGSPDLAAARRVSEYLDTEHHEWIYTADDALHGVEDVVRVIEHFDASLVRSAVPNNMLAALASQHVKVVLTGEGADEIFAGYEYQRLISDADELHEDVVRTIEGLHNLNLQRCDRVTMAHGLEARVPFLDRDVINFGVSLPAAWKVAAPGEMEKTLLRRAFTGWLPEDVLWRQKAQFGDGSGAAGVLTNAIEASIGDEELEAAQDIGGTEIRTKEELAYYRIWEKSHEGVEVSATLGRFATA
jgi:asparagine synthase (glutamine-hydrolysing)